MQTCSDIASLREQVKLLKQEGKRIAFVPTMGNLHEGHLALVKAAREHADAVVVSIFVNPMQFDKSDDLEAYPRTLDNDLTKLTHENVELVFTPTPEIMYPDGLDKQTFVEVPTLGRILEGAARPGHFKGVATVVSKLFNIVTPDVACFGEKDFQQLALIRQMVIDMAMDITIIGVPTVREMDGVAMSSRNGYLTVDERQRAPVLSKTMRWTSSQIRGGRTDYADLVLDSKDQLRAAGLEPDQVDLVDARTLGTIDEKTTQVVILMAAFLGKARLIDNQVVDLPEPKEKEASAPEDTSE